MNRRHNYSSPKSSIPKRPSLSKSRNSVIEAYLNDSLGSKPSSKQQSSTCWEGNPEHLQASPFHKLKNTTKTKLANRGKAKGKGKGKAKGQEGEMIEQVLREDVKLRVEESVQLGEWMEMVQQYKTSIPGKVTQANVILREFEKILELKENLQIRKYRLISSLI